MSGFADRKRAELQTKLGAITVELRYWRALCEDKQPLEKHHSQFHAVDGRLSALIARVAIDIDSADISHSWHRLEGHVLDLYRVWGYFRDKFSQRLIDEFLPYLTLADEFAVACYRPAQDVAVNPETGDPVDAREPPLTFLTNSDSPFSVSRKSSYQWAQGSGAPMSREVRRVTNRLPLPVIGLPWFELRHLPEAMVIAHEVGHVVHRDLIGSEVPARLVSAALPAPECGPQVRGDWLRWANEAFADVYGALCGGPSYRAVLADFLGADDPSPNRADSEHAPPELRIRLVDEVLAASGTYVDARADSSGAAVVAQALVAGPYPGLSNRRLDEVVSCRDQGDLGTQPQDLLNGFMPTTSDIRTLLAVAARAFMDDPATYTSSRLEERVLQRARQIQQPGTRAVASSAHAPDASPVEIDDLYRLLAEAGDSGES